MKRQINLKSIVFRRFCEVQSENKDFFEPLGEFTNYSSMLYEGPPRSEISAPTLELTIALLLSCNKETDPDCV